MRPRLRLALAIGGLAWLCYAPGAQALYQDKVLVRGFAGLQYNSNVLRVSDELPSAPGFAGLGKSDTILNYGVGLRLNLPVSRQLFTADVSATQYQYDKFGVLDYTGYRLEGAWNWRMGNYWSGEILGSASQSRQSYAPSVGLFVPALYRNYSTGITARYLLDARWTLNTGASWYGFSFNDEALRSADFHTYGVDFGATYVSPAGNSTGFKLRYDLGKYPNRLESVARIFDDAYSQYTISAVLGWQLTGASRIYGDIGLTARRHSDVPERDFTVPSGDLTYEWTPTSTTTLRFLLFQNVSVIEDLAATYLQRRGVDFTPEYRFSSKLTLRGSIQYRQEDRLGTPAAAGLVQREDEIESIGLWAIYKATRTFSLTAGVREERRSSNIRFGDYEYYQVFINGTLQF